ncbi:MAG: zinc ribbon domain-containing protein, partial [bacterium]|nr:zinc ribbon domain-containing protein [bacterium]
MITYAYRCDACGHLFEARQRMTDEALRECPLVRRSREEGNHGRPRHARRSPRQDLGLLHERRWLRNPALAGARGRAPFFAGALLGSPGA